MCLSAQRIREIGYGQETQRPNTRLIPPQTLDSKRAVRVIRIRAGTLLLKIHDGIAIGIQLSVGAILRIQAVGCVSHASGNRAIVAVALLTPSSEFAAFLTST